MSADAEHVLVALLVQTVRLTNLRYFVSQLNDAFFHWIRHGNLQLTVPKYQHATGQCRHDWVSYSRRASALLFLHQMPLSLLLAIYFAIGSCALATTCQLPSRFWKT
jgi:hypothetical protein